MFRDRDGSFAWEPRGAILSGCPDRAPASASCPTTSPSSLTYRRDHLRALAQRVEVADKEVRIRGSKSDLLRTLAAASGAKSAAPGVRSSVLKWRMGVVWGCPFLH